METVQYKTIKFQVWDLGGAFFRDNNVGGLMSYLVCRSSPFVTNHRAIKYKAMPVALDHRTLCSDHLCSSLSLPYRPYWRCYFANTRAIVYVIDSSDHARLQTSRAELLTLLAEEELKGVPVLIFSNKQVCTFPTRLIACFCLG